MAARGIYILGGRRLLPVIVGHAAIDSVIESWPFMVALTRRPAQRRKGAVRATSARSNLDACMKSACLTT